MDSGVKAWAERSPDGKRIDQLAKSGCDLAPLHQINFTLRFPTREKLNATAAENRGINEGWCAKIKPVQEKKK
jgi:hypothetical protein